MLKKGLIFSFVILAITLIFPASIYGLPDCTKCPDVDGDKKIDIDDVTQTILHFSQEPQPGSKYNLNKKDNAIQQDVFILNLEYNKVSLGDFKKYKNKN